MYVRFRLHSLFRRPAPYKSSHPDRVVADFARPRRFFITAHSHRALLLFRAKSRFSHFVRICRDHSVAATTDFARFRLRRFSAAIFFACIGFRKLKKSPGTLFQTVTERYPTAVANTAQPRLFFAAPPPPRRKCGTNCALPGALSHRSSSIALDLAYAVDFASKKSVLMRFALEYWLTHAMESGSFSYPSYRLPKPMPLARRLPRYLM